LACEQALTDFTRLPPLENEVIPRKMHARPSPTAVKILPKNDKPSPTRQTKISSVFIFNWMKLQKSQRCYPTEHLASGSKMDRTDPDYEDHRLQRMRAEYRSLPPEWRVTYLVGLCKKDAEAVVAKSRL